MTSSNNIRYLPVAFGVKRSKPHGKQVLNLLFSIVVFLLFIAFFILMGIAAEQMSAPLSELRVNPISLEYVNLLEYSLRTFFRMLIALGCSVIFALLYATLAAKNRYTEQILIPLLDILQSVPVLGYISFTATGFLALFPGEVIGAECTAIFAIFTSQVWNMAFSFYQSLKSLPVELREVASMFKMSRWQKFWQVEVAYGIPGLVYNMSISMAGGWFFVVASEAITVGNTKITLPGIGSYIAMALVQHDVMALVYAIIAMAIVILFYDQLLLRPLTVWSSRFHYDMVPGKEAPKSYILYLIQKNIFIKAILYPFSVLAWWMRELSKKISLKFVRQSNNENFWHKPPAPGTADFLPYIWYLLLFSAALYSGYRVFDFLNDSIGWQEVRKVLGLSLITMLRVIVLVLLASIIWVPLGIYIGINPNIAKIVQPMAQFLAAFPVNLLFPVAVIIISHYHLNPDVWLSILMIIGTQWYILFNVIAGSSSFPNDLREVSEGLHVKGLVWWQKVMLPAIMPYLVTGCITASGGAWNASIVAEIVNFGDQQIIAHGIGSYITQMTIAADFPKIVLGVGMMSLLIVVFNRIFWQPLYDYITKRFQL